MVKYYFVGFTAKQKDGMVVTGNDVMYVRNASLEEIEGSIIEKGDYSHAVVTSLKDLSEKEYEMLKGKE